MRGKGKKKRGWRGLTSRSFYISGTQCGGYGGNLSGGLLTRGKPTGEEKRVWSAVHNGPGQPSCDAGAGCAVWRVSHRKEDAKS